VVGAFFGVAGTVALVVGILALARRAWRLPAVDPHPHLSVVGVVGGVGILALIGWLWRPESGLIRRGWDRRGIRRVAAVSTTIALLVSVGGWVPMIYPVFLAGWVLTAPGVIILTLRQTRSPDRTADA
jgi:hypothetical protein